MTIAVCPGSFDPVTLGHLDIITRAAALFDEVTALVVINPDKKPAFTADERVVLLQKSTAHLSNVRVDAYTGLLANYVQLNRATAIVKGLRAMSDFEYEFQMALTNRKLAPEVETVFLTTKGENMFLTSSLIKQIAAFGGDISDFVPKVVQKDIELRLCGLMPKHDSALESRK